LSAWHPAALGHLISRSSDSLRQPSLRTSRHPASGHHLRSCRVHLKVLPQLITAYHSLAAFQMASCRANMLPTKHPRCVPSMLRYAKCFGN